MRFSFLGVEERRANAKVGGAKRVNGCLGQRRPGLSGEGVVVNNALIVSDVSLNGQRDQGKAAGEAAALLPPLSAC